MEKQFIVLFQFHVFLFIYYFFELCAPQLNNIIIGHRTLCILFP